MKRFILSSLALLATVSTAGAYDYRSTDTSDIDARRSNEARRIEEGRRSGQLTWREYHFLKGEQSRIAYHERQAKADGYVSPEERRQLNRELDHASADIHRLKHNEANAGWRRWNRWW